MSIGTDVLWYVAGRREHHAEQVDGPSWEMQLLSVIGRVVSKRPNIRNFGLQLTTRPRRRADSFDAAHTSDY